MKKLFLILSFAVLASTTAFAETLTMTTYYPAPYGAYDRIRLVPRSQNLTNPCDIGTMYVDSNNELQFCRDDGAGGGIWDGANVWTQTDDFVYPTDTSSNPDLQVGIGTGAPNAKLDILKIGGTENLFGVGYQVSDKSVYQDLFNIHYDGKIGVSQITPQFKLHMSGDAGILAEGTYGSGNSFTGSGTGTRLIWYPKKAAFWAGYQEAAGIAFNDAAIGNYSAAFGGRTFATGSNSLAAGYLTTASGYASTALNYANNATAAYSTAFGQNSDATGNRSFAWGNNTTASGNDSSTSFGRNTLSNGNYSTSMGNSTTASGQSSLAGGEGASTSATATGSIAFGYNNVASADYSVALNYNTTASGLHSMAIGYGTTASAARAFAAGWGNTASGVNSAVVAGSSSTASGGWSFATGNFVTASGDYSIAMGRSIVAQGQSSFGIGLGNGPASSTITSANTMAIMGGNVGIGTVSPSTRLEVSGDITVSGCLLAGGGKSLGTCSSDERLKKDITPISGALSKIMDLNPVTFKWRSDEYPDMHFGDQVNYGLIAQEVEEILPELVSNDEKGFKRVSYGNELDMLLLKAVQELKAENEDLKKRIEILENR